MARWRETTRLLVGYRRGKPPLPAQALWLAAGIFAAGLALDVAVGVGRGSLWLLIVPMAAIVFGGSVLAIALLDSVKRKHATRSPRS